MGRSAADHHCRWQHNPEFQTSTELGHKHGASAAALRHRSGSLTAATRVLPTVTLPAAWMLGIVGMCRVDRAGEVVCGTITQGIWDRAMAVKGC